MTLEPCHACGGPIGLGATKCPNCGAVTKAYAKTFAGVTLGCLAIPVAIALLVVGGNAWTEVTSHFAAKAAWKEGVARTATMLARQRTADSTRVARITASGYVLTADDWAFAGRMIAAKRLVAPSPAYAARAAAGARAAHRADSVAAMRALAQINAEERERFANNIEFEFLDRGVNADVDAIGPLNTTLRVRYILMSKAWIWQFLKGQGGLTDMRLKGFRKLVFTDGQSETWDFDVSRFR